MRRGVDIVYQGRLQDDERTVERLSRLPAPGGSETSALGGWSYEVLDAKLARIAKGEALLQLLLYSDLLAQVQGIMPERIHLALGGNDGPRGSELPGRGVLGVLPRRPPALRGARGGGA